MFLDGNWMTTFRSPPPSDGNFSRPVSGIYRTEEDYTKIIITLYVALAEHKKPGSFDKQKESPVSILFTLLSKDSAS